MRAPKSHSETMRENRRAGRGYAALFGKPVREMDVEPLTKLRAKKTAVFIEKRTERDVLSDIERMAMRHPKVKSVRRSNSGKMTGINSDGSKRFVTFNRIKQANRKFTDSRDIRIVDMELMLLSGKTMLIEVKEPGFVEPDWVELEIQEGFDSKGLTSEENGRLLAQKRHIDMAISTGNYGLFASDVSQVIDALERA